MAERELKKMNRSELIEIIYALQREEHELRDRIKQLEEKLTERNIILEKSGSIAEASLRLNKIFEDAQAAADQYVESVKAMVNGEKTFEDPKEKETDTDVRSLEVEWQQGRGFAKVPFRKSKSAVGRCRGRRQSCSLHTRRRGRLSPL